MTLSAIGQMVNDICDAGYRFDWPGMWCDVHPGGRSVGVYHIRDITNPAPLPVFIITCQPSEDDIIITCYDILTYPGGIAKWYADHMDSWADQHLFPARKGV